MRKVLVFGVFDGIHDGHRDFLKQARKCGEYLIAVVTRDVVVEELKGHYPSLPAHVRLEHIKSVDYVDEAVVGDVALGSYKVLKMQKPDVVAVGYDQERFKEDLEKHRAEFDWQFEIKMMEPYEPGKFHSSVLLHAPFPS
ncbi:MAG: adenylyltransferase/cytidyltransferase family protein [Patescibacteria group bacterium]|nr:adenylyltransferase/cytidyltransferase family protein [Patescibacteria group bacterium]